MALNKTVIPVAGLGTRFLPATKAQAKEMITLVDRPLIQYSVEEAAAAGFDEFVLVSAPDKESLERHFAAAPKLEARLEQDGKLDLLATVRGVAALGRFRTVLQHEPLGVGHALLMAREAVGDEPFGVMFPDDLILSRVSTMLQLRRVHERLGGIVIAVQRVPGDQVHQYGVIDGVEVDPGVFRVRDMVEKPPAAEAPSDLAIVGRYVLPASLFAILDGTAPGVGGEIQLTDAMRVAMRDEPCHAVLFDGTRYDCGNKLGFLQATVAVAATHPELGEPFRRFLREVLDA